MQVALAVADVNPLGTVRRFIDYDGRSSGFPVHPINDFGLDLLFTSHCFPLTLRFRLLAAYLWM